MRRITLQRPFRFYSCNILITCREGHKADENTVFDTVNAFCQVAADALPGLENPQFQRAPEYNIQVRPIILKIYSAARVTYYFNWLNGFIFPCSAGLSLSSFRRTPVSRRKKACSSSQASLNAAASKLSPSGRILEIQLRSDSSR